MRILALQLKRIGDLILTTPALVALRRSFPKARLTLGLAGTCHELLPALPFVDDALILRGHARSAGGWARVILGKFDVCLDFTGNDRSALCTLLSKAGRRITFGPAKKLGARAMIYNRFIDSPVRERHTVDHYCDLLHGLEIEAAAPLTLHIPEAAKAKMATLCKVPFVVVHPGTARAEKLWLPERWAAVIEHVREEHGLECIITGGSDSPEREHIAQIQGALTHAAPDLSGKCDLPTFAALIAAARACLSCDTAAVHLAAVFETPQIALYGMTNPFHWRPRHSRAVIISAAQPNAALTSFTPKMNGAPMPAISTETVIRATDALLGRLEQ